MRSINGSVMRGLWLDGQTAGLSTTASAREGVCLSGGTVKLCLLFFGLRCGLDSMLSCRESSLTAVRCLSGQAVVLTCEVFMRL